MTPRREVLIVTSDGVAPAAVVFDPSDIALEVLVALDREVPA